MISRAMISGLTSTGVNVEDLNTAWPALVRNHMRLHRLAGGVYVRVGEPDPESVEITFLASSGLLSSADERRGIERAYARQEYRRASVQALGRPSWPPDALERYADGLVAAVDGDAVRARSFRMVVDYGGSPASEAVPRVMGALGVEVIGLNAYSDRVAAHANGGAPAAGGRPRDRRGRRPRRRARHLGRAGAPDRRARRADLGLAAAAAARRALGAARALGPDRRAHDRDRPCRPARRRVAGEDPPRAGERRRADGDLGARRRALRRRRRRPRRARRHAAGRRRARGGRAAARAVGTRAAAALAARGRAAARTPRARGRALPLGGQGRR